MKRLLQPYKAKALQLKNHIVMAPMTRSRAIGNIPNALMAEYYLQRAGAGLIITEGTAPAPEGLGYPRMPGIYSDEQTIGWKLTTDAVHKRGSKIFIQLMHTGRVGHVANLPKGIQLISSSAIPAAGQIFTDVLGNQDHSKPKALTTEGVKDVIASFADAAENAIAAGFDGIEIHGANGYLIEQFLNPNVNDRIDQYGGTIENRIRFVVELVEQITEDIGRDKVGIRLSPFSDLGDQRPYDTAVTHETYIQLAKELNRIRIAYVHISLSPKIPAATLSGIRNEFKGTLIHSTGFTIESAEDALQKDEADLIAFGRNFLSNPDFVDRIKTDASLNPVDYTTLYSADAKGYTDYPVMNEEMSKQI